MGATKISNRYSSAVIMFTSWARHFIGTHEKTGGFSANRFYLEMSKPLTPQDLLFILSNQRGTQYPAFCVISPGLIFISSIGIGK